MKDENIFGARWKIFDREITIDAELVTERTHKVTALKAQRVCYQYTSYDNSRYFICYLILMKKDKNFFHTLVNGDDLWNKPYTF